MERWLETGIAVYFDSASDDANVKQDDCLEAVEPFNHVHNASVGVGANHNVSMSQRLDGAEWGYVYIYQVGEIEELTEHNPAGVEFTR